MSHILFEQRKFDELSKLLENALKVGGVQKSFVYNEYGRMAEVSGNFNKAVRYYKTAIRWSFGEQEIGVYRDNIRRCRDKRWIMMF